MQPQAVIFDIGNVLIKWQPERFYDREIGRDRRRALFDAVDLDAMNATIDMGAPFCETIYAMADSHPEWREEVRMWHDRWIELASPAIARSVRLLRALRGKGIPVFTLTNFGIQSFDFAATQYPFMLEFDRAFVSGHLQMMKPDPKIYEVVETDCGLPPEALIFTDDRPDNIAVARARGWQTHLFDGPEGWAGKLIATGLLSRSEAA
jgi:2-haloacid dehalogenase